MKRIWKWLIVIAFILLISPLAEGQIKGQALVDGWKAFQSTENQIPNASKAQQIDFFMGFVFGASETFSHYLNFRFPSGITNKQTLNVVGKYLDAHPEKWHETAVILVFAALLEAFPQKENR